MLDKQKNNVESGGIDLHLHRNISEGENTPVTEAICITGTAFYEGYAEVQVEQGTAYEINTMGMREP